MLAGGSLMLLLKSCQLCLVCLQLSLWQGVQKLVRLVDGKQAGLKAGKGKNKQGRRKSRQGNGGVGSKGQRAKGKGKQERGRAGRRAHRQAEKGKDEQEVTLHPKVATFALVHSLCCTMHHATYHAVHCHTLLNPTAVQRDTGCSNFMLVLAGLLVCMYDNVHGVP